MPRKRDRESIDEMISKKVENTIEEKLEEKELEDEIRTSDENDPVLRKILSSFPSSEGYYGKLYKILPSGKEEMKYTFTALEEISDPEVEVSELAKQRGWGSGDYRLRVYRHGASGLARSLGMRIDVGDNLVSSQTTSSIPPPSVSETLRETINTAATLRDIFPKPDIPMKELSQTLSETFKAGIQVTKEAITPQMVNSQDTVPKIISMLKELGLLEKKQVPSELEITERVIKNLKEIGIIGQQPKNAEDDMLDKLIKLKNVGLIKLAGEEKEDAASLAEKIRPLIDLVNTLGLGGNPPERLNFWNTLAPHIPTFFEKFAAPFKEYLEIRKIELQSRLGGAQPQSLIPQSAPATVSPEQSKLKEKNNMQPPFENSIINEVLNAVQLRDHSYFPKLKELVSIFIGPHVISALVLDQVSPETLISIVSSSQYGKLFNQEQSKIYLNDFVKWLKSQSETLGGNDGLFTVKCGNCKEEFLFNEKEWQDDNKICDCGGILERVIQESPIV